MAESPVDQNALIREFCEGKEATRVLLEILAIQVLEANQKDAFGVLGKVEHDGATYFVLKSSNEDFRKLTKREKEIAVLICDGLSNAMIAERLNIQGSTVSVFTRQIYAKLGIGSRTALMRKLFAVR